MESIIGVETPSLEEYLTDLRIAATVLHRKPNCDSLHFAERACSAAWKVYWSMYDTNPYVLAKTNCATKIKLGMQSCLNNAEKVCARNPEPHTRQQTCAGYDRDNIRQRLSWLDILHTKGKDEMRKAMEEFEATLPKRQYRQPWQD